MEFSNNNMMGCIPGELWPTEQKLAKWELLKIPNNLGEVKILWKHYEYVMETDFLKKGGLSHAEL